MNDTNEETDWETTDTKPDGMSMEELREALARRLAEREATITTEQPI